MTVAEIKAKISALETAETACLAGKAYTIDGVSYTRQDLSALRDLLHYWHARLKMAIQRDPSSVSMRPAVCIDRGGGKWRR